MLDWFRTLASRIRAWGSAAQIDREFEQELESHLELLTAENVRRGMALEEARRAARVRLGGITQLKETNRELRGLPLVETLMQDARYAVRMLRKNPGFTAVAVLTLALGIGANTAIFSVVEAVLLKPLPYPHAEQLFFVFQQRARDAKVQAGWSYLNFLDLREQSHVFSEMGSNGNHELTLTGRGDPEVVSVADVTPEIFSLLGAKPMTGRLFLPADAKPGAPAVVILSESLWRGLFHSDPQILGSSINLDRRPFTVVGVLPQSFRFSARTRSNLLWIPVTQDPLFTQWIPNRGGHWLAVVGRLKPGVSTAEAQAELDTINQRLAREFPGENSGWVIRMTPLGELVVGDVRPTLVMLWGAVGVILLIACANIASLLLARATTRSREIAVRSTLGAGRSRIVRQLLSESLVLGLLGGAAGTALAYWGVHALGSLLAQNLPQVNPIRVDAAVLGFALAISAAAGSVFGLAPAFFAAGLGFATSLREGNPRAGESHVSRRARGVLAAVETALAMALLVAAGLLLRSYSRMSAVSSGFTPENVVKANFSLYSARYSGPQEWLNFTNELLGRLHSEPGLQESALVVPTPIADTSINVVFDIVGSPALAAGSSRTADYAAVSPEYFQVLGIPLLAGREFDDGDVMSAPRVTLISQALARAYFPHEDPLGKQLRFAFGADSDAPRIIAGIVGDVRDVSPGAEPGPMVYVPFAQSPFPGSDILVRSSLDVSAVVAAIRRDVAQMDPDLAVGDVAQLPGAIQSSLAPPRFRTLLLVLFAALALLLAASGIFGVISYSVSRRTQEIGIRVALGASRATILRMVMRETLGLTFSGVALGVPCALLAARLVRHMLFGITTSDPATLSAAVLTLVASAVLAGYVPVRRAMRVDPMVALRHE
ncbi:MAG TPA: ABC transporter permease [Candidatus Acidoferrales bacterium]|nr:ABC transporter permease [Candidatus Acidoferrales bacterium]